MSVNAFLDPHWMEYKKGLILQGIDLKSHTHKLYHDFMIEKYLACFFTILYSGLSVWFVKWIYGAPITFSAIAVAGIFFYFANWRIKENYSNYKDCARLTEIWKNRYNEVKSE